MDAKYNIVGQKFNKLEVVSFSHKGVRGHLVWNCLCDCGNSKTVSTRNLRKGHNKSCGCLIKERREQQKDKWSGKGYLCGSLWSRLRLDAEKRKMAFDITKEEAEKIFWEQKGKCALTGMEIDFGKSSRDSNRTASFDRIDSSKGYIKDNVQWLHKEVNVLKWNLSEKRLFELAKLIVSYNGL